MTTTPPEAPAGPPPSEGPRATREELKELGRVRRTIGSDRKVAGVAGGLGRHLDIDPVILRVAFVVLVFFGGAGLIAYGACWLLLPEDGSAKTPLGLDDRNRGIALIGAGILASVVLLSGTFGNDFFPWPVAVIGVLVFVVLGLVDRDRPRPSAPPVPHAPDPTTGTYRPAAPGIPVAAPPPYRSPPRVPRRRGPILFFFTIALAAVGVAALGIVDLAGGRVADPAYPAVVVGACGVMLRVGAFYGRAGGLILVGLLASVVLFGATVTQELDGGDIRRTPTVASDVPTNLDTDAGEIVLDLRNVQDLAALNGRSLHLKSEFGRVEVILPPGVSASVDAEVHGAGHIELFGSERGGFGLDDDVSHSGGFNTPAITIEADVTFGEIQVHTERAAA
jgi:phage shock protein PspC (stress-responsive transcriptional regulator)